MPTDCLCAGVRVMTLRGEIAVENLRVGDRVMTLSGNGTTLKPLTRIGRISVDLDRHAQPLQAAPVRIRAGAFEPGMPIRDLLVSPDHAVSVEDEGGRRVLIPALNLVNGATILREPPRGQVAYFQVELAAHDILMADGMAVESTPGGEEHAVVAFAPRGAAPPAAAAPDPDFTPAGRSEAGCVPYVWGTAAMAVHARLLQRAHALGHRLTEDPDLGVLAGETPLAALSEADGEYVWLLPRGGEAIRLRSRTRVPYETDPAGGDTRRLGVALARVLVDGTELPLTAPAFGRGFLPAEGDGVHRWRWTTGEAELAIPPRACEITLELHIHTGWSRYWEPLAG
jgi:hypothetical protein